MVKRLLIVIFLMTQPVAAECKYYAEADVVNDVLVNKKEHYTCKEKESFFIRFLTKRKSLVLDPFAGSNTTGYVASKLGRKWLSIEKDLNYIKGSNGWFK